MQQIKVQGLTCKMRQNAGVQLQFTQGFDYMISELQWLDWKWLFPSHKRFVLRNDSLPSSSTTISGVKAQSRFNRKDAWHSLAIKPDKMRERKRGKHEKKPGGRTGKKERAEPREGKKKTKVETQGRARKKNKQKKKNHTEKYH